MEDQIQYIEEANKEVDILSSGKDSVKDSGNK